MRIEKRIAVDAVFENASSLTQPDYDELVLQHMKHTYSKNCHDGAYIYDVKQIINRSSMVISCSSLQAHATCSVEALLDAEIYEQYELVIGKVSIKTDRVIILTNDIALFALSSETLPVVELNVRIPILISRVSYPPNQEKMSCIATPLIQRHNYDHFEIDDSEFDLSPIIARLNEREVALTSLRKNKKGIVEYFEKHLTAPFKGAKGNTTFDKLNTVKNTTITRASWSGKSFISDSKPTAQDVVIKTSRAIAFGKLVGDYIREIDYIITLATEYEDMLDINNNFTNIWEFYDRYGNRRTTK